MCKPFRKSWVYLLTSLVIVLSIIALSLINSSFILMLITKTDIKTLRNLSLANDLVPVDTIPASFKNDFQRFFLGKTLTKDSNNRLLAYPHDIRQWVRYVFNTYQA